MTEPEVAPLSDEDIADIENNPELFVVPGEQFVAALRAERARASALDAALRRYQRIYPYIHDHSNESMRLRGPCFGCQVDALLGAPRETS